MMREKQNRSRRCLPSSSSSLSRGGATTIVISSGGGGGGGSGGGGGRGGMITMAVVKCEKNCCCVFSIFINFNRLSYFCLLESKNNYKHRIYLQMVCYYLKQLRYYNVTRPS